MPQTTSEEIHTTLHIHGMHCGSCEILLERTLQSLRGMKRVSVNHRTGVASLVMHPAHPPSADAIEDAVRKAGYSMEPQQEAGHKWPEIGGSLLIIVALWKIISLLHLASLAPSMSGALSLNTILLIGIVAGASSCLAVTGGLLLAAAATYNAVHPSMAPWERFKPLLQFNIGRLVSYFLLGGMVGIIGKSISFSARTTGILNIGIAVIMLFIALKILKLMPKGSFGIRPPKALSHWIHNLAGHEHPLAPMALGALTFFLPCGFTQSLQLVALASGSFWTGAMTMFIFALGTLPALLGISVLSSTASGTGSRLFLRFAGTLVFVLALFNLQSALVLTGVDVSGAFSTLWSVIDPQPAPAATSLPAASNGVQEVSMIVHPSGYDPSDFTVKAGLPVRWTVDGTDAYGCISTLVVPSLGISRSLQSGPNVIEFTPTTPGRIVFSCSMGMYRGSFNVR